MPETASLQSLLDGAPDPVRALRSLPYQSRLTFTDSLTIPRADAEPHRQFAVRVTVAPSPFDEFARQQYRR